jgi:L-ascorbate metabolism protein UlaG (beta-lactamase superfamily)
MSRVLASLTLLLSAAVAAPAADTPSLSIRWHGQSFFEITTTKGTNIVLDPHAIPEYPRVSMKANLVLMSHLHDDHTQTHVIDNLKELKQDETIINALKKVGDKEEYNRVDKDKQVKDVKFRNVAAYHDDAQGLKRGKNGIWIIEADGLKIVHLGDLGHQLTDDQIKKIGEVDILMIPVGGVYTLNGIDAQKVVRQLNPRHYVIPMHYGTSVYDSLLPIKSFIEDLDEEAQKTQIKRVSGNEMLIDPAEKAPPKPTYVIMGFKKLGG